MKKGIDRTLAKLKAEADKVAAQSPEVKVAALACAVSYIAPEFRREVNRTIEGLLEEYMRAAAVSSDAAFNWFATRLLRGSYPGEEHVLEVMRLIAVHHSDAGTPLPHFIHWNLAKLLSSSPERKKTGKKPSLHRRDAVIRTAVDLVCHKFDLQPTRNSATPDEKESGCSIVAGALLWLGVPLREKTIEGIWNSSS